MSGAHSQMLRAERDATLDGADDPQQQEIHLAVNQALDELAAHLGGTADQGGPVENATRITAPATSASC